MWRVIWKANKDTNKLRIIVDYDWNVITGYPIDNFQIN